ncbi:MAG TPA: hypothetical protein VHM23_13640 [Actinomycetota bacterium]|jgi:hypothetical protein|nr:hypothetical protein [Actinomycetota bacterium]
MRPVRIVLVFIVLIAVGLAGWALGNRGGYGQPGTDPAIAEAPPALDDQAAQDDVAGGGNAPSVNAPSGGGAAKPPANPAQKPPAKAAPKLPKPEILRVSAVPSAPFSGGYMHLDPAGGQVTFRLKISNATRAQFWLSPTGQVTDQAVWLGEDRNGRDGWTTRLHYTSQPLFGELIVRATGPGGTTEEFFGVVNEGYPDELTEEEAPEDQKATEDQTVSEDQKP